jgi:tungstate transport system substrate-binding protein
MGKFVVVPLLVALVGVAGCAGRRVEQKTITLATTTSTQDSGLLDVLLPLFEEKTGTEVKAVAVGTGQALELGRRGDADVLLVHDPDGEKKFMSEGHGALRREVFHNDFILVGPPTDPAGVKGQKSIAEAFARIAARGAAFVSRGDESGTHVKEKAIWRRAGVEPRGAWYIRAGAGMGQVLRLASEKRACALADRGTFLALNKGLDLVVLCEGDPRLRNPYSVIVVSRDRHPHVRDQAARRFADFLSSAEGRRAVGEFGKDRFGQPLFFPARQQESEPQDRP